jgi:pimeloyl-ACP methyl ester carboxylesterase
VRKVVALVAIVAVLAVILVSAGMAVLGGRDGGSPRGERSEPTRNERARAAPEPGLARFYDQTLRWRECGRDACARMEVPLDYDDPDGRTIEIALLKRYADGERVGSLVVNPGGPGAPGTSYASNAATFFRPQLTRRFDVVGFDPRGTGDSAPVDCLSDDELDAYLAGDPDPDTPAEVAEYVRLGRSMGAGCAEADRELAAHVSTVEAARDMDVLRAVLEEESLVYFGASYGTKLGATYAELFPDRTGRLVLDGAVDVSLSSRELTLEQAAGFDRALRAYVQNCLEVTDSCFLGASVEQGMGRIEEFLRQVDRAPVPAGARELTPGYAFYGIVAPLYNRDYWFYLSTGLKNAFEGDGTVLLSLADAYASRRPDGTYADNSMEAIAAISCLDDPSSLPAAQVPGVVDEFEEASPLFGRTFAWSLTGCSGQRVEASEEPPTIDAAGAPPLLVIGTTRDPATPMEWAEALAEQLEPGVLVRRDGDGHTGYNAGNQCVDRAVEAYLLEGVVPPDPLSC